jgi:hypothetical protein
MKEISSKRVPVSCSVDQQSKRGPADQNLKWGGLIALALAFALRGAVAQAQQARKVLRMRFLDPSTASGVAVLLDAFRREMRMARQLRVEFEGALDSSNHPSRL